MRFNVKKTADFYNSKFDEFGRDIKSVGWGSKESQQLRFSILSEIADLQGSTVCDLGCGFGELYLFLRKRFPSISYTGIDISDKLLAEARRIFPELRFACRDILKDPLNQAYDYVLSSGALTYKLESHEEYVEKMLEAMFRGCRKGVAVNFLSTYVDNQLAKNFHYSPEKAISFAKRLTKFVVLRHDYPLYEFTIYLYRTPV